MNAIMGRVVPLNTDPTPVLPRPRITERKTNRPIRVFVAGPMSSPDPLQFLRNIQLGVAQTALLYDLGFAPFLAFTDYVAVMQTTGLNLERLQLSTLEWLRVSEVMLLLPGYHASKGAMREFRLATELGIPVFHAIEPLVEWRKLKQEATSC